MIESIDETVEPCEDFYHFVCGTWIKNTRIPDDGKTKKIENNMLLKQKFSLAGAANTLNLLRTQLDHKIVGRIKSTESN